jgi:hypothetical protein
MQHMGLGIEIPVEIFIDRHLFDISADCYKARLNTPRPAPASGLAVPDLADITTAHGRLILMLTVAKGAR